MEDCYWLPCFSEAFVHARETRCLWSLLFTDRDDFKQVNDALGHYYGDEFLLLLQGGAKEAGQLARQLIDKIKPVFDIEGAQLHVGASGRPRRA